MAVTAANVQSVATCPLMAAPKVLHPLSPLKIFSQISLQPRSSMRRQLLNS
jgi:hypothetical protein